MAKPSVIDLLDGPEVPILYEDRSALAIDKPAGWMLAPDEWTHTGRNLQRALALGIHAGEHWARSRQIKYLRFAHRLDAETSGALLLAKSPGALSALGRLFETRSVKKKYLAVTRGVPKLPEWVAREKIGPTARPGVMRIDPRGKDAETRFRVLASASGLTLLLAEPMTGRTHQIRIHAAAAGVPVAGDALYGEPDARGMGLRAVGLAYIDPFQKRPVRITAPSDAFLKKFEFPPLAGEI